MNEVVQTIRQWIDSVLGTYEPVTYTETLLVSDNVTGGSLTRTYEKVADGLAGVDWSYIFTALCLLVVIYSVFRLLGVLLQAFVGGGKG